jgi:hypothetical protein
MGRPPIYDKPMTEAERKRRQRLLATAPQDRAARIRRAFEVAGADAQALFIKWLRKMKLIE